MEQSTPIESAVGIDVSDRKSEVCVLEKNGEVLERTQISTTEHGMHRFFSRMQPCRVALEVGTHSPWLSRLISSLGHEVFVANPRKLRLITESDSKNDTSDAQLLAELVQAKPGLLRPIQHRKEETQAERTLLHARSAVVRLRTALVNHIRGSVKCVGARMPSCDARSFHKHLEALPEILRSPLEPIMKLLREVSALIRGYDKEIERKCDEEHTDTKYLRQVNGVGPVVALGFITTIEDPNRFPNARAVGSYIGLRPRQSQSGTSDPQLRITKTGDKYLRWLLVSSAQYILGPHGEDCDLRRWGLSLMQRGGKNAKKRAVVAVARKLSVLLLQLWRHRGTYDALRTSKLREVVQAQA